MNGRRLFRLSIVGLGSFLLVGVLFALTAANTVPATRAGLTSQSIGPNDLKPTDCAGITLTALVVGSGVFEGVAANELILGGPGADQIRGRDGDDCVLGGGGDDQLRGDAGTDVCIGGPGTDTLDANCETQVQ